MVDRIEVQVAPLRDILSKEGLESALLKLDTEGYEYKVFSALDADREPTFDYVVFEYSGRSLRKAGVEPTDLLRLEFFAHYDLYRIGEDGSLVECNSRDICALEEISDNFLLVKKDRVACLDSLP